jgi:hypothetical protein
MGDTAALKRRFGERIAFWGAICLAQIEVREKGVRIN